MDEWEEFYNKTNGNYEENLNQQDMYRPEHFGYASDYSNGDNMLPRKFNECFMETNATVNLKKWLRIYKICAIVFFILFTLLYIIIAYNSSLVIEKGYYTWEPYTKRFDIGIFIVHLILYGILSFVMFLSYKLTCAILNCIAQITRNTGISAKLAAFNTRDQMMKDANKEKES